MQFFTLSFEIDATDDQTNDIVKTVSRYLKERGAKDILMTHSARDEEETGERERQPA